MGNQREIKRLIIKLLKFIPLLLFIYVCLLFFWGETFPLWMKGNLKFRISSYGHSLTRFREVKTLENIDVLFLGSSHAYRGFDVRLFQKQGYNVFNMGSGSQTPMQTKVLVDRYLDKLNPDTVVYEVNLVDFSTDGVEGSIDLISNEYVDFHMIAMALQVGNIQTINTILYRSIYEALGLAANEYEPVTRKVDTYVSGGFVEKKLMYYKGNYKRVRGDVINPRQLKAFEQIVTKIREKGIYLLLVQAPVTTGYYNGLSNSEMFDSLMKTYAPYVNYNKQLEMIDNKHFFDAHHLNQIGVEKFNKALITQFFNKK
jgi:hypothetical protein